MFLMSLYSTITPKQPPARTLEQAGRKMTCRPQSTFLLKTVFCILKACSGLILENIHSSKGLAVIPNKYISLLAFEFTFLTQKTYLKQGLDKRITALTLNTVQSFSLFCGDGVSSVFTRGQAVRVH